MHIVLWKVKTSMSQEFVLAAVATRLAKSVLTICRASSFSSITCSDQDHERMADTERASVPRVDASYFTHHGLVTLQVRRSRRFCHDHYTLPAKS